MTIEELAELKKRLCEEIEEKEKQLDAIGLLLAIKEVYKPEIQAGYSWPEDYYVNNPDIFDFAESLIPADKSLHATTIEGDMHYRENHETYYFMIDDNTIMQADFCILSGIRAKDYYQVSFRIYRCSEKITLKVDPDFVGEDKSISIADVSSDIDKDRLLCDDHFSSDYIKFENQNLVDVLGIVDLDEIITAINERYHIEEVNVKQKTR